MPPERFSCFVDTASPWAVVSVVGPLDRVAAAHLRLSVLKCLAEEPTAIIVDLGGLTDFDDGTLTVFSALARAAAAWPGIRLILHSARPPVHQRLDALAVSTWVTVATDADAAEIAARNGRGPVIVRADLAGNVDAGRRIRGAIRDLCDRNGWLELSARAEAVAGELIANAIQHATGPHSVIVSFNGQQLHIAVRDTSAALPRLSHPNDRDEHGRGLLIVTELSAAWGSTPTADGKVVWATLRAVPSIVH